MGLDSAADVGGSKPEWPHFRRKLLAVVHADMVGYSLLIGLDDIGTARRMHAIREAVIDPKVAGHEGHIAQTAGDSLLILFESITAAVQCAIDLQHSIQLYDADVPPERKMRFRVGVEIGDVVADWTGFHGEGVNIAARLQVACPPGGVCVSRTVHDHVRVRLGLAFQPLGLLSLKNINRPIEAFVFPGDPDDAHSADADIGAAGDDIIVQRGDVSSVRRAPVSARAVPLLTGRSSSATAIGAADPASVAVLPFANEGDLTRDAHLGDGIVEDIIANLANFRELMVISRSSTLAYGGSNVDVRMVGEQLGARYVLSGSVRRSAERLRITAELCDAETSMVVWSGRYDEPTGGLFDIQDEVTAQIVHHVAPLVHAQELRRISRKRPESIDAYDLVLQALHVHHLLSRKAFSKARQLLRRAMKLEPGYAMPYALMAEWYGLRHGQGWSGSEDDPLKATRLAAAAIERDPHNIRALVTYGHYRSWLFRDYDRALLYFERALSTAPNSAQAWGYTSPTFSYLGDGKTAIERAERCLRLSPRDPLAFWYHSALALGHLTQGTYDEAAYWSNKAYLENGDYLANIRFLIASLVATGRITDAAEIGRKQMQLDPLFRVNTFAENYAYRDPERRKWLGDLLLKAGLPA